MSEPDKYDKEAAEMLPCIYLGCATLRFAEHINSCPAFHRPAVAASLRANGQEIERLKYELSVIGDMAVTDWNDGVVSRVDTAVPTVPETYADARRAELAQNAQLRAEIERLKSYAKNYTGFEAQPCPFCTWDNGKFIAECGFHREIALLKAKIDHYIKESFENLAEAEKCGMEKAITEIENDGELGFSNRVRLIEAIRAAMPKAEGER